MLLADIHPPCVAASAEAPAENARWNLSKTKALILPIQPFHKLLRPVKQAITMIDHAIHIAEEALLCADAVDRSSISNILNPPITPCSHRSAITLCDYDYTVPGKGRQVQDAERSGL